MQNNVGADYLILNGGGGAGVAAAVIEYFKVLGRGNFLLKYIDVAHPASSNRFLQSVAFTNSLYVRVKHFDGTTFVNWEKTAKDHISTIDNWNNSASASRFTMPDGGILLEKKELYYIYLYFAATSSPGTIRLMVTDEEIDSWYGEKYAGSWSTGDLGTPTPRKNLQMRLHYESISTYKRTNQFLKPGSVVYPPRIRTTYIPYNYVKECYVYLYRP